jgi:hypothetical protein
LRFLSKSSTEHPWDFAQRLPSAGPLLLGIVLLIDSLDARNTRKTIEIAYLRLWVYI